MDWDLGDKVTYVNQAAGVSLDKRITEVVEISDSREESLGVTFGEEYELNLLKVIHKEGKKAMRSGFFDAQVLGYDEYGNPQFDRAESAGFLASFISGFVRTGVSPGGGRPGGIPRGGDGRCR